MVITNDFDSLDLGSIPSTAYRFNTYLIKYQFKGKKHNNILFVIVTLQMKFRIFFLKKCPS